ncbi:leucine--tRNA ligase [Plasmodium gonderi]|uniref:leucine--tRNA ligase n=1 Tax=Plasmodium gonderi TaxID=77519 RepID=A0A1Y1JHR6_PLAGO|nr:leucine--tRNA ligase [Plasmodium gonderi]GAW79624.1 leucine--tRNA ligase [Plasmodium gonderi]
MPFSLILTIVIYYLLVCKKDNNVFSIKIPFKDGTYSFVHPGHGMTFTRNGKRKRYVYRVKAYDFRSIERKWQIVWNSKRLLDRDFEQFNKQFVGKNIGNDRSDSEEDFQKEGRDESSDAEENFKIKGRDENGEGRKLRRKFYILDMFPYPSAQGLHMGHILCFTITDVISKFKRMNDHCVFHPIGWDSFGLPCDRLSMKLKVDPRIIIKKNILNFKKQLIKLGFLFNWDEEINTCDESFYKWTQWIIIQMYMNRLGYKKKSYVNWSKRINCVISNDEMKNEMNNLEFLKIKKMKLLQWYLRITKYANRLIDDLKLINWPEKIKNMQINWIGEKKGIIIKARIILFDEWVNQTFLYERSCKFMTHVHYSSIYRNVELTLLFNYLYSHEIDDAPLHGVSRYEFFSSFVRGLEEDDASSLATYQMHSKWPDRDVKEKKGLKDVDHTEDKLDDFLHPIHLDCNRENYEVQKEEEEGEVWNLLSEVEPSFHRICSLWESSEKDQSKNKKEDLLKVESYKIENEKDLYVKIFLNYKEAIFQRDKILISVNHPNIKQIVNKRKYLLNFVRKTVKQSDNERLKNESIYFTGSVIYNPIINQYIPIFVCAFILENNRNILFVKKGNVTQVSETRQRELTHNFLRASNYGKRKSVYNLRDWLFSRQRYWGEPFPFLFPVRSTKENEELKSLEAKPNASREESPHMENATHSNDNSSTPKKESTNDSNIEIKNICNSLDSDIYIDNIPVHLPKFDKRIYEVSKSKNKSYTPVLSRFKKWIFQKKNNVMYKRECDIMPQWAGSSWYYLRYLDSKNKEQIFDKGKVKLWLPVDLYVGGSEHAVLHLLYARFFHKFLYDLKLVNHKEPFQQLFNQGILLSATSFFVYTTRMGNLISYSAVLREQTQNGRGASRGVIHDRCADTNTGSSGSSRCSDSSNCSDSSTCSDSRSCITSRSNNGDAKGELNMGAKEGSENGTEIEHPEMNHSHERNMKNKNGRGEETDALCVEKEKEKEINNAIEKMIRGIKPIMVGKKYKKYQIDEEYVIQREGKYYLKKYPDIEVKAIFEKMSKSKGNTVNPNDVVKKYGSDCLRLHILFLGPIDQNKKWNLKGIKGTFKFLNKLYNFFIKTRETTNVKRDEKMGKFGKKKEPSESKIVSSNVQIGEDQHNERKGTVNLEINENKNDMYETESNTVGYYNNNDIICLSCMRKKRNKQLILKFDKIRSGKGHDERDRKMFEEKVVLLKKYFHKLKSEDHLSKELSSIIIKKKNKEIEKEKKEKANYYINKITTCINTMKLNTAVSFFMMFFNEIKNWDYVPLKIFLIFIKLLYPFCPHICEEFWFYYLKKYKKEKKKHICYFCNSKLMFFSRWPSLFQLKEEKLNRLSIRLNNKHVAFIDIDTSEVSNKSRDCENVKKHPDYANHSQNVIREATNVIRGRIEKENKRGKKLVNVVYIPNRVINFVMK